MWRKLLDSFSTAVRTCFERRGDDRHDSSPTSRHHPPRLLFQTLEPRVLLSADLLPADGVLQIIGTDTDDSLFVRQLEPPTGGAPQLEVILNGESFEFALEGINSIKVDLLGGNDALNAEIAVDVDWDLTLGDGNDRTQIEALIGDQFADAHYRVDAGGGDNETTIRFGDGERGARLPSDQTNITAEYRSGGGNDRVTFDWLVHLDRDLNIGVDAQTGAGDDQISWEHLYEFRPGKTAQVDYNFELGEGSDAVEVRVEPGIGLDPLGVEVRVSGEEPGARIALAEADSGQPLGGVLVSGSEKVRLETGGGNDRIVFDDVTGALRQTRFDINAGAGDDEFNYLPVGRAAEYLEGSLQEGLQWTVFDGGEGEDRFTVATSDRAELIEISGLVVRDIPDPLVRVTDLATTLVTLQASLVGTEFVDVDSAGGDDRVTMSDADGPLAGIAFDIELGEGDDTIKLRFVGTDTEYPEGPRISVGIDSGDGNDTVEVDATGSFDEFLLGVLTGDGDDVVRHRFFAIVDRTNMNIQTGGGNDVVDSNVFAAWLTTGFFEANTGDGDNTVNLNVTGALPPEDAGPYNSSSFQIISAGGDDTVNASFLDTFFDLDFIADTGGGNDALAVKYTLFLPDGTPTRLPRADFDLATGNGDDILTSSFVGAFGEIDFTADTGAGNDTVAHELVHTVQQPSTPPTQQTRQITIIQDMGPGDDISDLVVDISQGPTAGETAPSDVVFEFTVLTGSGSDQVFASVSNPVPVEGGEDPEAPSETRSHASLSLNTGEDDDAVSVMFNPKEITVDSSVPWQVLVATGGGDDAIALLLPAVQKVRDAAVRVRVDGGEGVDALTVDTGDGPAPVGAFIKNVEGLSRETEVVEYQVGIDDLVNQARVALIDMAALETLSVRTGDGADQIVIDLDHPSAPVPALSFSTGGGDDTIDADFVGVLGDVAFNLDTGAGNDTVDVNVTEAEDIVTGAGAGGVPLVKAFSGVSGAEIRSFFAYDPSFADGVFVAAGDITGASSGRPGAFKLAVDTGQGNDRASLEIDTGLNPLFAIELDMGTGADSVALDWHDAALGEAPELQASVQVLLGGADAGLPEVGDEVLVSFESGDPDQPIIIGAIWNSQDAAPPDSKGLRLDVTHDGGTLDWSSELQGGSGSDSVQLYFQGKLRVAGDPLMPPRLRGLLDMGAGDDEVLLDFSGLTIEGAADQAPISFAVLGGAGNDTLVVKGTGTADTFIVSESTVTLQDGADINFTNIESIFVGSFGGDDTITTTDLGAGTQLTLDGGAGNDALFGGAGDDILIGGDGHDLLVGGPGNDRLDGGAGNDVLFGGRGDDTLLGGPGDDLLIGGAGDDVIDDGEVNAALLGGFGSTPRPGASGQSDGDGWLREADSRRAPALARHGASR